MKKGPVCSPSLCVYLTLSLPLIHGGLEDFGRLTLNTDMTTIARAMAAPDSGLDIRDRMWLKITISSAFIGRSACRYKVQRDWVTLSQILKQNPGFSSCCNHNYKHLGQSGTPWLLQADRLSDYQDIYDWKSKSNFEKLTVFITLQSIWGNEYCKTGHSKIFTFLRHFLIILKRNFVMASILHHITDTW